MSGRRRYRLLALIAALAALALVVAGCGGDDDGGGTGSGSSGSTSTQAAAAQPGKGKPPVTIGDKNFTEEFILGELYAQALRAKGFTVTLKPNIGSSEIIDKALKSGQIDMYPDYVGTIVSVLAGADPPASKEATYAAAKRFEEKDGFTLLDPTPFFNTNSVGVMPAFAQENGLKTIEDLEKLDSFTYADTPENLNRLQGVRGLRQVYGLKNLKFRPLAIGLQYNALKRGDVDTADVFSTDAQLTQTKLVLLEDTKHIFGFQNVAPVVSRKTLQEQGPAFAQTINEVSSKLTVEAMRTMNAAVDIDKQQPKDVARQFLEANQLT
jgi:osmoprotectant transport system substrate-binding protein